MLLKEIQDCVQQAVAHLLATDGWRRYQGEHSQELKLRLSDILGQTTVELASSGTAALEIVLRGAGVKSGDEVLMSAYDYPGNFWAVERIGARPVLIDVMPGSWSIAQGAWVAAYSSTCKAVIASHLHGELQAMANLRSWCDTHGLWLIEDTCQAIGARLGGAPGDGSNVSTPAGSLGHAAIVSFGGGKVLTCGRGGAWGTSDASLAQRARLAAGAGSGPYGLSEIQAAIVLAQLPWLDKINQRCRDFFTRVNRQLGAANCNWNGAFETTADSTAFYQAGWILPAGYAQKMSENQTTSLREDLVSCLSHYAHTSLNESSRSEQSPPRAPLPFGIGFPGFHRRSSRRCRLASSLPNATIAAERTLVVHHSIALTERFTADEIATHMLATEKTLSGRGSPSTSST